MAKQFHAQSYTGIEIIAGKAKLPVYDPVHLANELERTGIADPSSFLGLANSFTLSRGATPSQGFFLMLHEDVTKLDFSGFTNHIRFTERTLDQIHAKGMGAPLTGTQHQTMFEVRDLRVAQAITITGVPKGTVMDKNLMGKCMVLVQFADQRSLANLSSIAKAYNVRTPAHSPDGYLGACAFSVTATKPKFYYVLNATDLQCADPNEDPFYVTKIWGRLKGIKPPPRKKI